MKPITPKPRLLRMVDWLADERLRYIKWTCPEVRATFESGGDVIDCLLAVVASMSIMDAELIQLKTIAPRRYKGLDGIEYVWHCPDSLVPLEVLSYSNSTVPEVRES